MSANDKQVGGTHYQTGSEQHWDLMAELYGDAHFKCAATKYISRWNKKGGIQDLEKALHYLEKLMELSKANKVRLRGENVNIDGLRWLETCDGDLYNAKLCKRVAEVRCRATLTEAINYLKSFIAAERDTLQPPP